MLSILRVIFTSSFFIHSSYSPIFFFIIVSHIKTHFLISSLIRRKVRFFTVTHNLLIYTRYKMCPFDDDRIKRRLLQRVFFIKNLMRFSLFAVREAIQFHASLRDMVKILFILKSFLCNND